MGEEMVGLFKCRNCGAVVEEKVNVSQSIFWGIRDLKALKNGLDDNTTAIPKSSLPSRFIIHWCKKDTFGIGDLIGWKVGEEEQNDGK